MAKKCYRIKHRWKRDWFLRVNSICVFCECQRVVRSVLVRKRKIQVDWMSGKEKCGKVKREKLRPTRETFLEMKYEQK